jgi:hypothetical protein
MSHSEKKFAADGTDGTDFHYQGFLVLSVLTCAICVDQWQSLFFPDPRLSAFVRGPFFRSQPFWLA